MTAAASLGPSVLRPCDPQGGRGFAASRRNASRALMRQGLAAAAPRWPRPSSRITRRRTSIVGVYRDRRCRLRRPDAVIRGASSSTTSTPGGSATAGALSPSTTPRANAGCITVGRSHQRYEPGARRTSSIRRCARYEMVAARRLSAGAPLRSRPPAGRSNGVRVGAGRSTTAETRRTDTARPPADRSLNIGTSQAGPGSPARLLCRITQTSRGRPLDRPGMTAAPPRSGNDHPPARPETIASRSHAGLAGRASNGQRCRSG